MNTLLSLVRWILARGAFLSWVLAPILAVFATVGIGWDYVLGGLTDLNAYLDGATPGLTASAAEFAEWYVLANTFFPVTEAFAFVSIQMALSALAMSVRIVKSLIPTIS